MRVETRRPVEINLDINGITLLSKEEYINYKSEIPDIWGLWWLRSPSDFVNKVNMVNKGGVTNKESLKVDNPFGNVRPALKINLKSSTFCVGDKFTWARKDWTIISENYALCDEAIEERPFNENEEDGNDYNTSDIKSWLEGWFNSHIEE